jgi:hypothetical protein
MQRKQMLLRESAARTNPFSHNLTRFVYKNFKKESESLRLPFRIAADRR